MLRGTPIRRMRGVLGVVLAMIVLMGLASPSSASAAAKPVVTHVSPASGSTVGGTTVTVRGKHFAARGKSAVKKVLFGKKAATHVRVLSASMIKATAPAGTGVVDVTVTTTKGRSAKVPADRYTYRAPAASRLVITKQPVGGLSGALLATEPVVKVEDSAGNVVPGSASITATSSAGSTLAGTATVSAVGGVATFSDLTLAGTVGTNYTLNFAASGLTSAISVNVSVTASPASKLVITTQPVGGVSGALLATEPVVKVEDAAGNVVPSSASITATSSTGSTLAGTTTVSAVGGVATFSDLTLAGTVGTNYTLNFAASGLTSAISGNVSVTVVIGTSYGGGVVAYILQPADPGYVAGETHGLIAASDDQSLGIVWALPAYQTTSVAGTGTAIGTGLANTNKIIAQNGPGSYAAAVAAAYGGGGYGDWYLPSKDELNELYLNRVAIGGFPSASTSYWSSSEALANTAWTQDFSSGDQGENGHYKWGNSRVRPVRAF